MASEPVAVGCPIEAVTSDSAPISVSNPDAYYGVEVDKNGDDLNYDLELWYCA